MAKTLFSSAYRQLIAAVVEARKAAGLTQRELAQLLGKPQNYVGRVETEQRRLDFIELLAWFKACGVDAEDIADMLAEMGYGLDLDACAATGATSGLTHVSPRTGRAVSAAAAEPYIGRLLALPAFLVPGRGIAANDSMAEVLAGLDLTGHFLENRLFAQLHAPIPAARHRLLELVRRSAGPNFVESAS